MAGDMLDGVGEAIDQLGRQDGVEIFGAPIVVAGGLRPDFGPGELLLLAKSGSYWP